MTIHMHQARAFSKTVNINYSKIIFKIMNNKYDIVSKLVYFSPDSVTNLFHLSDSSDT